MNFQREHWSGSYDRTNLPRFHCPRCSKGRLHARQDYVEAQPQYSKDECNHPDWEPGWDVERFHMTMQCNESVCGEIVVISGDITVAEYYDGEIDSWALVALLRPRSFFPAPPIIVCPKEVPALVVDQLKVSFQLFWVDLNACANRLRISVELLLDHFGIPRTTITKKAKQERLDLHGRIAIFDKTSPEHAPTLTALRLIGNLGSHGEDVNREALLDAFEIYEHSLAELCGQRSARIDQLRKKLIASKGKGGI